MRKEVVVSLTLSCLGAPTPNVEINPCSGTTEVSLTIYKDGKRDVGCSFLSTGLCQRFGTDR